MGGYEPTETSKMFHKIKFYNAILFSLIFLLIFETINLDNEEENPTLEKPQWELLVLSVALGSVASLENRPMVK